MNARTFDGVKVFSSSHARERAEMGDRMTQWLKANRHIEVIDTVVTQTSDRSHHCLTVTFFYRNAQPDLPAT